MKPCTLIGDCKIGGTFVLTAIFSGAGWLGCSVVFRPYIESNPMRRDDAYDYNWICASWIIVIKLDTIHLIASMYLPIHAPPLQCKRW